jgi:hypothetical protein
VRERLFGSPADGTQPSASPSGRDSPSRASAARPGSSNGGVPLRNGNRGGGSSGRGGRGGGRGGSASSSPARLRGAGQQGRSEQQQQLYDPSFSPKPKGIAIRGGQADTTEERPVRDPRGPDSTGAGFAPRGAKVSTGILRRPADGT